VIVHKILLGRDSGKYLPFALARLAEFERISKTGIFAQRYLIEGHSIHVKQLPPFHYVYIIAVSTEEAYFEFQTSGLPVEFWTFDQGGITGDAYKVGVVGVNIRDGVATAQLLGGERVGYPGAIEVSRIKRQNQVILLDEPVHYYSATANNTTLQIYPRMLYDAWAPLHPHTGLHFRSYHNFYQIITVATFLGSNSSHFARDIGYDVPWSQNTSFLPTRAAGLDDPVDWPRKTGLQYVQSAQYGDREFAIYIDAYDQVSVFPTSEIGPEVVAGGVLTQNVDPIYVKTARVTFPSWVFKKTQTFKSWYAAHSAGDAFEATGLHEFPEYDWRIHPDGTKMCTVVYEREPAVFNEDYFSPFATDIGTQGPGTFWPDPTSFDVMNAYTMGVNSLGSGAQTPGSQFYMSAPGLVEVEIVITITGSNPESYTLSLNCTEIRRPTTSTYCTFLAGYAWYDMTGVTRGDMCVMDIECYGRDSDGIAANLYSLKNLTAATELKTFGGTSAFTSGALFSGIPSVLAYNFETLSFVFKYRNIVYSTDSGYSKRDIHFGVSVYTFNTYRHTFFPTTMPGAQQTAILNKVDVDMRAAMTGELGSLTLMPLNDLSDWSDDKMARLRYWYCRKSSKAGAQYYGAYSGNPTPFGNPDIANIGYKYWKEGADEFSAPTTAMLNWFQKTVRHGILQPYILFDLETPRPGWWQHMGHIIERCEINPHTTFFVHPNGTWAFFNQSLIYNGNGIHIINIGSPGLGYTELDVTKLEHCIFDKVHFNVPGPKTTTVIDTSFRELYNEAIVNGTNNETLTDASQQIAIVDMKTTFTLGSIVDRFDASVTYALLQINWPFGYTAYYKEMGYFTGTKGAGGAAFDAGMVGGVMDLSLAALWKDDDVEDAAMYSPDMNHRPITFSTCVMITT
jgi:hypothetical protein